MGVVAHRSRVIAHRGAGDRTPFGSLRSTPLHVIADDAVDLYTEVDEVDPTQHHRLATDDLTVVFVHGYSMNLDCWHFQRAGYRGQVRTVFYDQRSHGRSARSTRSTRRSSSSARTSCASSSRPPPARSSSSVTPWAG